jgi:hypothetical protein
MNLTFTLGEAETLAFSKQYYRDSAWSRRVRNRTRWAVPAMLLPVLALYVCVGSFPLTMTMLYLVLASTWFVLAPLRFDARVMRYSRQQFQEASIKKTYGVYRLSINDDGLISDGPTGHSEIRWEAVDRVVLTDGFLFIFLVGLSGFPIRVSEIGEPLAQEAYVKVQRGIQKTQ